MIPMRLDIAWTRANCLNACCLESKSGLVGLNGGLLPRCAIRMGKWDDSRLLILLAKGGIILRAKAHSQNAVLQCRSWKSCSRHKCVDIPVSAGSLGRSKSVKWLTFYDSDIGVPVFHDWLLFWSGFRVEAGAGFLSFFLRNSGTTWQITAKLAHKSEKMPSRTH